MNIQFQKLITPTLEIAETFNRWDNDPHLIPFIRPNKNQEDIDKKENITVEQIMNRLQNYQIYLIYLEDALVGEISYRVDPSYLFKKELGTAWIGINIGEEIARGKGVGVHAMQFLEEQIRGQGLKRIELGVFEFNTNAFKLYQKSGYREIGRIENFTYWNGKLWQDIRMEKYLNN